MIRAVYKQREDGDYDFVAAFETEQLPELPSDWPAEIIDWLKGEGEVGITIQNIELERLPMVWKGIQ